MKLSDFRGEDALDVLADIIEPVTAIFNDKEIKAAWGNKATIATCVKIALKSHKKEVIEIMAALEQEPYDEFLQSVNVLTLPIKAIQIMQDKDLRDFFTQSQMMIPDEFSGDATEATSDEA